ncbi:MAG: Smr/MutS family protein [Phyllobacteriaceae bacterium]|jgi:DNA-nicking Smr family endonuclease|nr:Smr/MutS family protein [Phyllobacteriaceae bacterium]
MGAVTEHRKTRKSTHPLSLDDRILWNKVARTVNPLDRARHRQAQQDVWDDWVAGAFGDDEPTQRTPTKPRAASEPKRPAPPPEPVPSAPRATRAPSPAPIEQPVYRKLSRGRTPIDASIDLHNMNQDEAMSQLHRFLVQARARECRHVLVITGKGRSPHSDGVLRRMVPFWLSREPFAGLVSGVRSAARGHGGEGAFYVRLRKPAEPHGHRNR